jgi:hypothetical protein
MGMGMGELQPNQKYVVILEVYGPSKKGVGDQFDRMLRQLRKRFGSRVKFSVRASKKKGDPRGTLARKPKRAARRKRSRRRR